eukprot:scaffold46900_cov35-Tisochrysis_lutea.AAC.1
MASDMSTSHPLAVDDFLNRRLPAPHSARRAMTPRKSPLAPPTAADVANHLLGGTSCQHGKRFDSADHVLRIEAEKLRQARKNLADMRLGMAVPQQPMASM